MTSSIRHGLVALTLTLAMAGGFAQAQTAGSRTEALAREIMVFQVKQIDLDALAKASMEQVIQSMRIEDPKVRADLMSLGPIMREEMEPVIGTMVTIVSAFYRDTFSADELVQLRDFYASPVGIKATVKGSEFSARMMSALQVAMQQRGPAIGARIQAEMQKRGHKL